MDLLDNQLPGCICIYLLFYPIFYKFLHTYILKIIETDLVLRILRCKLKIASKHSVTDMRHAHGGM
ncbi:MAG TPA: hypothetical protein DCL43_12050 [Chitinophagaceae bacterium]|nr:hypothetical protein [Chitinophagaceae bacterium]HAN38896.1 hypothetical protein [Chitinophagaceae bacterium]